jgi:hypothetical protein
MQIVRTIFWVLVLVGLLAFSFFNWRPVEVAIWDNLVVETKVPALVIVSFLLGLVPTWLYHRGVKWRLSRRVQSLENAVRSAAMPSSAPDAPSTGHPAAAEQATSPDLTSSDDKGTA